MIANMLPVMLFMVKWRSPMKEQEVRMNFLSDDRKFKPYMMHTEDNQLV